ncbi:hypothetical protein C7974DRAFT_225695 [Boeremia exigua]|uniref:uncharacterized protein n=1 Tax=Boeremia exigua TaxID=749465 RepID=UPI001E8CB54B|nr:uncharacterized protein C7974DRAFT_225695 [Boeremia exigua]KAH6620068.1 hypothetical protein C7974DRAFT_225695 [Boeremia exigua]
MGQLSSRHAGSVRDSHRSVRPITSKHTKSHACRNSAGNVRDAPTSRRRTSSHLAEGQSTKSLTLSGPAPARRHKEHPARHSNKSILRRKSPVRDRGYDEPGSIVAKQITGSQLSLTVSNRRTPRQKKECLVCTDNRLVSRFPTHPPTARCVHNADVCRRCLRTWIDTSFADRVWDEIDCPVCSQRLAYEDVREFAPSEIFRRYKKLSTKAALEAIPGFHWCLTRGCKSGQVIRTGTSKFCCVNCKNTHCIEHNMPWHKRETCKEFDYRTNRKLKKEEEIASKKWLKEKAKRCPGCKRPIEKANGCDHMTCSKCRHEFCWECRAPYKKPRDVMSVAHRVDCIHHVSRTGDNDWDGRFYYGR